MKNILKFDLYKLVKSKSTWIVFAVTMVFHAFLLAQYYSFGTMRGSVAVLSSEIEVNAVSYLLPLFVLLFVGKDFSNGYIKNIYSSVNKIYYILSKAVVIALAAFAMYIGMFLLDIVFNFIWGLGQFYVYHRIYSIGWCLAVRAIALLLHIVGGFWIMFFYLLVRSRLAVFAVDMVYINGLQSVFLMLLTRLFVLFGIEEAKISRFFRNYFLYSMRGFYFTLYGTAEALSAAVIRNVWVLAIYAVVFLAGSCFVFSKRKF